MMQSWKIFDLMILLSMRMVINESKIMDQGKRSDANKGRISMA